MSAFIWPEFFHGASFLLLMAATGMYVPFVPACVRGVAAHKRSTKLVCTLMATAMICHKWLSCACGLMLEYYPC